MKNRRCTGTSLNKCGGGPVVRADVLTVTTDGQMPVSSRKEGCTKALPAHSIDGRIDDRSTLTKCGRTAGRMRTRSDERGTGIRMHGRMHVCACEGAASRHADGQVHVCATALASGQVRHLVGLAVCQWSGGRTDGQKDARRADECIRGGQAIGRPD